MKKLLLLLLLSVAVAMLYGCGYSLATRNSTVPAGQSLTVQMFANRTYQANIEGELRRALVNELVSRGQIVSDEVSAFEISGEIVSLSIETAAFSAVDRAMIYRVVVEIRMQLAERQNGKVIWKGSELISQEYPAAADLALQRNAREAALSSICATAAQRLVASMNQSF